MTCVVTGTWQAEGGGRGMDQGTPHGEGPVAAGAPRRAAGGSQPG